MPCPSLAPGERERPRGQREAGDWAAGCHLWQSSPCCGGGQCPTSLGPALPPSTPSLIHPGPTPGFREVVGWVGGKGSPPRPAEGWGLEHRGSLVLGGAEVEDGSGWHPSRGSEGRVRPGPRVLSATPSGPLPCGSSCFISPRVTGPPAWSGGWEGPKSPGTPPTAPSPTVAWPDQAQLRC